LREWTLRVRHHTLLREHRPCGRQTRHGRRRSKSRRQRYQSPDPSRPGCRLTIHRARSRPQPAVGGFVTLNNHSGKTPGGKPRKRLIPVGRYNVPWSKFLNVTTPTSQHPD
jgi:hypothetical protein